MRIASLNQWLLAGFVSCLCSSVLADDSAVRVKTVQYRDIAFFPEHSTAAEVIAKHDSRVAAEISAAVVQVMHDTGDRVTQGETIIELDCRTHELGLQQAKSMYDAADAQYSNAKKLFQSAKQLQKQNSIAKELYNQREADAARLKAETANAKAGMEAAAIAVAHCSIKAPFDGYISARFINKGELAQPGTAVFQIVTSAQGQVEANINSFEYNSYINGDGFQFVLDGVSYSLVQASILPVLDKINRTHTARLVFADDAAPSGSRGELRWRDTEPAIPSSLVVTRDGRPGVLVANSTRAKFIPVAAYTEGHPAFIRMEPDTQIISIGRHGVKDGDLVNPTP